MVPVVSTLSSAVSAEQLVVQELHLYIENDVGFGF